MPNLIVALFLPVIVVFLATELLLVSGEIIAFIKRMLTDAG